MKVYVLVSATYSDTSDTPEVLTTFYPDEDDARHACSIATDDLEQEEGLSTLELIEYDTRLDSKRTLVIQRFT